MKITRIPFDIDFPIKIFSKKEIDFKDKNERDKIFKRNIYFFTYRGKKNHLLEERSETLYRLSKEIELLLKVKYPLSRIESISVFGSALYSKNPEDYDFLVILNGNHFDLIETTLTLEGEDYQVGISIKGTENFLNGSFNELSGVPSNLQGQIIYRTVASLFKRHIPVIGKDFKENRKLFERNVYSHVSDLINNAYDLFYANNKRGLSYRSRARKILSRLYESTSFISSLRKNEEIESIRKEVYLKIISGTTFKESKIIFGKFVKIYQDLTKHQDSRDKFEVLSPLKSEVIRDHIGSRLTNYWKSAGLPYHWMPKILSILCKNSNEDVAIKEIRKNFREITLEKSRYNQALYAFRRIKIGNLSRRLSKYVRGTCIADVGGRTDDLIKGILSIKKNVKKAYVTDLHSFTEQSGDKRISFALQSSANKLPFKSGTIDTLIVCMVLHHLNQKDQFKMITELSRCLKVKGKLILIEDTYPEDKTGLILDELSFQFLNFNKKEKRDILYFYDWFGNRLMRNRDDTPLNHTYQTMEKWEKMFSQQDLKKISSKFVQENSKGPDLFSPKAVMVFEKE